MTRRTLIALCSLVLGWNSASAADGLAAPAQAAQRVDELLQLELFNDLPSDGPQLAPRTTDQQFLRRVYLDLVGVLPSPEDITAFALDPAADKRQSLIRRLLAQPHFGQNWARYWRDVIFYRRTEERALLAAAAAENYLTDQFNAGASWDKIAASFIEATGDVSENGATALLMSQMGTTEDVTAEVSRIFMGVQIQCAQCHDHPTDRWKRQQFHELAAFFPRLEIRPVRQGDGRSFAVVSVERAPRGKRPNMRRGELEHHMPDLKDPAAQGELMTPTFFLTGQKLDPGTTDSVRRGSIADWLTAKDNPWFSKAFVNRIWAELVGEGFYEPVDDIGPDRKASAPAAMDYLAEQFAVHDYNVKWLFETVTGTEAYQRASRPRRNAEETPFLANGSRPLRSDELYDVVSAALGLDPPAQNARRGYARPGQGGPRRQFAETFGYDPSDPRAEIAGSIPQALMLMNSPLLGRSLTARSPRAGLGRLLTEITDNEELVVELHLRTLAREPNREELKTCLAHVRSVNNRPAAFEDILWALINRAEFLHRN